MNLKIFLDSHLEFSLETIEVLSKKNHRYIKDIERR